MRMEDNRFPKRVLLGTLATGKGYRGGQESDWVSHLGEDLVAFGMKEEKEGARWQTSALKQEEWFGKIEDGVARFMRKWHTREAEASAKRKLARAEETPAAKTAEVAGENAPPTGPKRKRNGGATAAERAPRVAPKTKRKGNGQAAVAAKSTTPTGPKEKDDGGTPAGGERKKPETAVEAARAAEIALVAHLIPD